MLLSFCCCFVMVDALWSIINDLSRVAPNQVFQMFKPWYCSCGSIRSRGSRLWYFSQGQNYICPQIIWEFQIRVVSSFEMKSLGACCIVVERDNKEELWWCYCCTERAKTYLNSPGIPCHTTQRERLPPSYKPFAWCMMFFFQKNTNLDIIKIEL